MKKRILTSLIVLLAAAALLQAEILRFEESETIQKTLRFSGTQGPRELQVDNIFGSIRLSVHSGNEIQVTANKTIKGRTKAKIEKAKKEVLLDITEEGNLIDIFVDGPFRAENGRGNRNRWDPGYRVYYEFDIKVPRKTDVFLKTVTDGDITVSGIEGRFEIRNVNGKIMMSDIDGSGSATTVNGNVQVGFSRNPEDNCAFKSVNGDLELKFQDRLSADFRLKTWHGDAYTDFAYEMLPVHTEKKVKRNGKYVYKYNQIFGVRVGKGGPEISMDTLNGDLLIKKQG